MRDLSQIVKNVRVPPAANLHATLAFVGEIDGERAARLIETLRRRVSFHEANISDSVGLPAGPIVTKLAGVGCFPARDPRGRVSPRVFWVGLEGGREPLTRLSRSIITLCQSEGAQPDTKPFHPHVTIGRARAHIRGGNCNPWFELYEKREFGEAFEVSRVGVYESVTAAGGPAYRLLASVPFVRSGSGS